VIPLFDLAPTRRFALVTYALIAANVLVFLWERQAQNVRVERYAFYPCAVSGPCTRAARDHLPWAEGALSSLFLHASWWHLGGNMLFLFIFGNNVEDRFGRWRFALFYLLCGYTATYAFAFTDPNSTTPLVGASGAIAGVLGAYLWLYPRARIVALVPFLFFIPLPMPAWLVLGSWFGLQAIYSQGGGLGEGSVAYVAHVVGFAVGFVLTVLFVGDRRQTPPLRQRRGSHGRH
jgi:membrane associated rhomboid family serine protease